MCFPPFSAHEGILTPAQPEDKKTGESHRGTRLVRRLRGDCQAQTDRGSALRTGIILLGALQRERTVGEVLRAFGGGFQSFGH